MYYLLNEWEGRTKKYLAPGQDVRTKAGEQRGLVSHAGLFRGACISSLPTSSPKNACMRGKAMSCVLIESQIFSRQPYLTQSISILSYGRCVFEFFWRSENASMAAFAPFFKEPMISLMPLIRKASELYLNEFTAAKYKYSEKFTIKSALFHLIQRKFK